ncbi:MAG TPA: TSUP family transporter [bacterium]|nr:TSUP family transporter [bacterium]
MFLTLFVVSMLGGFMSGLLGLGGVVVLIPLMLTIPPILGVGDLSMKTVSGLSMIQVLFSSISGMIIHKKNKFIHYESLLFIGTPMGFSAFV